MAVETTTISTVGKVIFDLQRGNETTSRTIEIPFPSNDTETIQTKITATNATFTNSTNNIFIQPVNWRDTNITEEQWTTTGVHYELVTTTTTPVTPETPTTLGAAAQDYQQSDQQG